MRLIHTSDWHIGQNFYSYERDSEHRHFFAQLAAIMAEHKPDALVVSGDVFHNAAPPVSAQNIFVDGVISLHDASPDTAIIITSGNHDSAGRLAADRNLWRRLGVHVVGGCRREPDGSIDPSQFVFNVGNKVCIVAVPYFHQSNFPAFDSDLSRDDRRGPFFEKVLSIAAATGLPVVMMAHLAVEGCDTRGHDDQPVGGMFKDKISILGDGYDYLALGHIHMPQRIGSRAAYCGSALPVSFSEDYDHYVNLVEIDHPGELPKVTRIKLDTLRRVVSVPTDGAPLEEALNAFADFDPTDPSYVRVLVDQPEPLPPDAEERARLIAGDKQCRFCEVHRKKRELTAAVSVETMQISDVDEFSRIDPLDIARRSYLRIKGVEMPDELVKILKEVIVNSE